MGFITVTDDDHQPVIIGSLSLVIGNVEFLPREPTIREIAREAVERSQRKASRRQIINRIKARFTGTETN